MATVGLAGGIGAMGGAAAGWFMGGLPGAAAFGQLGGALGLKIGAAAMAGKVADNAANDLASKLVKTLEVAGKYLLAGGTAMGAWWVTTQQVQSQCANAQYEPSCEVLKWANVGLVIVEAGAIVLITKRAIDRLNHAEPRKGGATFEEKPNSEGIGSTIVHTVTSAAKSSVDSAKTSAESSLSGMKNKKE